MLEGELRAWLCARTGLELNRGGAGPILQTAVEHRCRELGCRLDEYVVLAKREDGVELELLINAMTVVYTWFFRDPGQLLGVEEIFRRWSEPRPIRVWIPGCATGEDVYSVSLMAEQIGVAARILGTDVNTRALAVAERGEYSERDLKPIQPAYRAHFRALANGRWTLTDDVLRRASFIRHNLVDPVPVVDGEAGWDVILCRNVFIYFEAQRALEVFHKLAQALNPGGHLLLGAGEIVYEVPPDVRAVQLAQRIAFQRVGGPRMPSKPPGRSSPGAVAAPGPHPRLLAPSLPVVAPVPAPRPSELAMDWLRRGHACLAQSRLPDALQHYERAVTVDPTSAQALMYCGIARYLQGEVERAASDLRAALFGGQHLMVAIFYLALSYESMGLPADALREYRRLVERAEKGFDAAPAAHDPLAGWYGDILQLARHRLDRARSPS